MGSCDDETSSTEGCLTGWLVLPGGTGIGLRLAAADGQTSSVVLPFDALSSLLMTLPQMLQAALEAQGFAGQVRVAQPLGRWRFEEADHPAGIVMTLATPDGFEVAFVLDGKAAGAFGQALVATSQMIDAAPIGPPH